MRELMTMARGRAQKLGELLGVAEGGVAGTAAYIPYDPAIIAAIAAAD